MDLAVLIFALVFGTELLQWVGKSIAIDFVRTAFCRPLHLTFAHLRYAPAHASHLLLLLLPGLLSLPVLRLGIDTQESEPAQGGSPKGEARTRRHVFSERVRQMGKAQEEARQARC